MEIKNVTKEVEVTKIEKVRTVVIELTQDEAWRLELILCDVHNMGNPQFSTAQKDLAKLMDKAFEHARTQGE